MAKVKIIEQTQIIGPILHRSAVTAVDAVDPPDTLTAVDSKGYTRCQFDITITGTDFGSLEVQAMFWNPRQQLWFGGGKRTFTEVGRHALVVECRARVIFLKVTGFAGTSFSLSADYALS